MTLNVFLNSACLTWVRIIEAHTSR